MATSDGQPWSHGNDELKVDDQPDHRAAGDRGKPNAGIDIDVYAHLLAGCPGGWRPVRARYRDLSDRTFWRRVQRARALMAPWEPKPELPMQHTGNIAPIAPRKSPSHQAVAQLMWEVFESKPARSREEEKIQVLIFLPRYSALVAAANMPANEG
jgi:hypothetical protein